MRRRTFILGVGLGALSLTACGGSKPNTGEGDEPTPIGEPSNPSTGPKHSPKPPVKTHGLNELVVVKDWDLAIQKVERRGKRLALSQFTNTAVAAGTWFLILIDMKNTSGGNLGVTPAEFTLSAGEATFPMLDSPEAFAYSEVRGGRRMGDKIAPGVSVTYYAIFDVPEDATNLHLTFTHDTAPVFAVGNATL